MEAAEDASLVAAIGWLVQTILASLLIEKLDAWIRRAGLTEDVERLKSEVERVDMVVGAVKGRAVGNKPLARSLARLKELLYDADDVVDELDYYRLQQQVQGVTFDGPESMHGAERVDEKSTDSAADIASSSGDNLRSKNWKDFKITKWEHGKAVEAKCIHCDAPPIKCGSKNGTSVLSNHLKSKGCSSKRGATDQRPNPSSTVDATANAMPIVIGDSFSRKRRRRDEESAQITAANTHTTWDKAELSNRIQKITSQLQDLRGEVSEVLKLHGSDSVTGSDHYRSTTSDQHLRTSSLVQRKMYGRADKKESIIKLMGEHKSGGVTVLPIVGIAGVGKTALAQLIYNDPTVESQFDYRIWVWVSHNFDEVRLTREMLDFVSPERHEGSPKKIERYEGISSFAKLQEILKGHIEYQSKRILLIFDDVWDNMDDYQWNKLLVPLKSSNGNMILVTTRSFSVAQRTGTVESIKLGALANKDFSLLFKAYAFGDGNYEGHQSLSIVGMQITEKLEGNPLAAETAGALLREHLTIDHWSNILMNEDWKSLQTSRGIMPALKLSYDQLPYHLQQCFSCSSIFPYSYKFRGDDLVRIWISQGFVKCNHSNKRLEEIGQYYLTDLVNLGFFQQVEEEQEEQQSSLGCQIRYTMCGLIHDFARIVSRTECATIDGLQCTKMLPTIQHLSIVTYSAYSKDQHGNIPRNEKFEEKLRNTVTSVGKFRTLVLLGHYDSFFFELFQDIFQKAQNLRLLQISAASDDFSSFQCSLANPVHLRYLKHDSDGLEWALPQVLIKCFHLQVLDVGSNTKPIVPNDMNNLVSMRHLVADKEVYSSIASISSMTSLQELHDFKVQISSGFEITQLQSMNELVQLEVSQLDNVKTREEAYGAGLRNKEHLEKLHLFWKDNLSDDKYVSDTSSECSEPSMDIAREVLEGLEPHMNLKHLQISGYNGASLPTWLASNISVTSLRTLHLDCCVQCQMLPSLEMFPFLSKLKLSNMQKLIEVLIPSLEELVLVKMPNLERCSCMSVGGLNFSLRALQIKNCHALKVFDLFQNDHKLKIEQKLWLPGLRKLILRDCRHLEVLNPFPPSTALSELHISGVPTLLPMKGSTSGMLDIGFREYSREYYFEYFEYFDESSGALWMLDDKVLALHNLRSLNWMIIGGLRDSTSISFNGFSQLVSLKRLEIYRCEILLSSLVLPERICEVMQAANCKAFPSLECLTIGSCGIAGKWLPLMLRHAPNLEELTLDECPHITTLLSMEEEENSLPNLVSAREDSSSGNPDDALTRLARDRLLHVPLNPISSLKKITVSYCLCLTFNGSKEGLSGFTTLEKLVIRECPKMFPPLVHKDGNEDQANGTWLLPQSLGELEIHGYPQEALQPCFPRNLTCLKKLSVLGSPCLKSLQLCSLTSLEELIIGCCGSLTTLEGLQSLGSLRNLELRYLKSLSRQAYDLHALPSLKKLYIHYGYRPVYADQANGTWLLPQSLGELEIDGYPQEALQPCFPRNLTCLKKLSVWESPCLKSLQLCSLTSLEKLIIKYCESLTTLEGLQSLGSLRNLELHSCSSVLEHLSRQGYDLHALPSLKRSKIFPVPS